MDYHFITPDKLQNLNQNYGDILFSFQPNENVNFYESSFVIKIKLNISKNKPIPAGTALPSLRQYFIYSIFNELELMIEKKRFSQMQYISEYIKATQVFSNNPRDKLRGLSEIKLSNFEGEQNLVFNIPLRFLFSELKNLISVDQSLKEITVKLQRLNNESIFTDLNDVLSFTYEIKSFLLKIPQVLSNMDTAVNQIKHAWKTNSNSNSVKTMVNIGKGDLTCFSTTDRPLNFVVFFFDANKQICQGVKSIMLMLNNKLIPHLDLTEETDLEHYYEMYLRHVEYVDGCYAVNHHEKNMNVWSYDEFCKHPIYFFILPVIKETGHYDVKLKLVFEKNNNKIEDIFYMYNYLNMK